MLKRPALVLFKFKQGGGCERYILDLVNGFNEIGITPTVYSTFFDKKITEFHKIIPKLVNLTLIPKKLRMLFLSSSLKKSQLSDEISLSIIPTEADILFCGGQHKGYLQAIGKRANLLDKLKIYCEDKSYKYAKKIIAHSELMKQELISLYQLPADKIDVVYPPVDHHKFYPISDEERTELRTKLGFSTNEAIFLFPSTGHTRKGLDVLRSFFDKTTLPVKLVIAGTPVSPSKNILSLGFRGDMPDLYRAADFTIMASQYEPFGLVGIESILSGTPVVFSENIACTEVIRDNAGLFFNRDNPEELKAAIERGIELVKNRQARIKDPFGSLSYDPSLSHHIQRLLNEIEELS